MGNYDFTGLSARSFEKLTQALAVRVLGPGTIVFGDGPDGGREATYEGRVSYPSPPAEQWNGYVVLQAKFRQRLTDKATDSDWAVAQLREELKKFVERKGGRRPPEYYIFATNAVLSPVQDSGGKDRAAEVFAEFSGQLPLRGWAVWDYDQLSTFLDTEEAVRNAYAAFITPGDVLAAVMKWLQPGRQDFIEVMTSYLAQELNAAKYANLEQTSASKILLARVFVDLPISKRRLADPPDESMDRLAGFVGTIIEAARERLDPATRELGESGPARYVLVGGPGQGKTTAGQFACQLFRAAILKDRPRHLLSPEVADALNETKKVCDAEEIELPSARRFPLHVVLSEFATAVSRRKTAVASGQPLGELTLFTYLREKIRTRTNRDVKDDDFRAWLGAYPWLLVLDGLDEVPSSSNRAEVLQKIEDFWIEAAQANADLLAVATTRPQDYHDDFSPQYYSHRWLVPLSTDRALKYGQRLVQMRHGENPDRVAQLSERLRDAASSEATARLMRTPLQVTIMATLVEQVGKPPQDRWRLFDEYYGAIYRRERERTQSELLGRHQSNIDAIHYRTGLELQILSEAEGGTDARLSAGHFEAIVRQRLENEGHEGAALERLTKDIVDAAAFRLVFIVGLDIDSVGFEIRSLQEFMAAEALLAGETTVVQKRLRAIAGVPSWRNVFVFAAGRCFAKTESLIDTIHAICQELNSEGTPAQRAVQAGSVLALELLEDAAAAPKPKHARLLARAALALLDAAPDYVHARLAAAYTAALEPVYREEIDRRLKNSAPEEQLATWRLLVGLIERDVPWALEVAERYWPTSPANEAVVITAGGVQPDRHPWLTEKARWCLARIGPIGEGAQHLPELVHAAAGRNSSLWDLLVERYHSTREAQLHLARGTTASPFAFTFVSIENWRPMEWPDWLSGGDNLHPTWKFYSIVARESDALDREQAANILQEIAETNFDFSWISEMLPWPLAAALTECTTVTGLREMSSRFRSGELADRTEWLEAERRWERDGVTLEELRDMPRPWPQEIATTGFPYQIGSLVPASLEDSRLFAEEGARRFAQESDPRLKSAIADWLVTMIWLSTETAAKAAIEPENLIAALTVSESWTSATLAVLALKYDREEATHVLETLGRRPQLGEEGLSGASLDLAMAILKDDPALLGVARLIATYVAYEPSKIRAELPPLVLPDSEPPHVRSAVLTLMALTHDRQAMTAAELARTISSEFPDAAVEIGWAFKFDHRASDEAILLALHRELQAAAWNARSIVRDALENVINANPGPPRGTSFWRELGFDDLHLSRTHAAGQRKAD
ncbi:MAG TPA: hypothetical protein VF618_18515 [Thermoanaerobaculia bacterium]